MPTRAALTPSERRALADSGLFQNRFDAVSAMLLNKADTALQNNQPAVSLGFVIQYLKAERLIARWDETLVAEAISQGEAG